MNITEAWETLAIFLKQHQLNYLQELIFRQSWHDKTYREIADNSGYTEEYIRDNGAKLWQLLSRESGKKVTKQNFKLVIEEHYRQQQQSRVIERPSSNQHRDWSEAIDVSLFCGRSDELTTLKQWIVEAECAL